MRIAVIIAAAAFSAAAAQAATPLADPDDTTILSAIDDSTFDAGFQCPETLADEDSRVDEWLRYAAWAQSRHPDWTFGKRQDVRYGLLRRHACAVTLAHIASSQKPAFTP